MQKFEVSVNYIGIADDGLEKKMKSVIWMDADTFGYSEQVAYKEFEGEQFQIMGIKPSKIADVVGDIFSELFFVAKIKAADVVDGKEKAVTIPLLIGAKDIDEAKKILDEWLTVFLVPTEIKSIGVSTVTKIML